MSDEIMRLGLNIFAEGAGKYSDSYEDEDTANNRIVLHICIANRTELPVILDTGAPWCVLDPLEFEKIADHADFARDMMLNIRGESYIGGLYRIPISIEAVFGKSLEIDATVFVPNLPPDEEWIYPNFVGLDGFLNRIRFAVDPKTNLFFFGTLDD
jgi:hypothetical protein